MHVIQGTMHDNEAQDVTLEEERADHQTRSLLRNYRQKWEGLRGQKSSVFTGNESVFDGFMLHEDFAPDIEGIMTIIRQQVRMSVSEKPNAAGTQH